MVRRMAFALVATAVLVAGLGVGTAAAQSVDDIVALNYKSKGGDKWKTIQTMKQTGVASAQGFGELLVRGPVVPQNPAACAGR